jgi:protein-disulfide isomerase
VPRQGVAAGNIGAARRILPAVFVSSSQEPCVTAVPNEISASPIESSTARAMDRLAEPVHADDHILGAVHAPVTLVEYADFECLQCGRAYPDLQRVVAELPGAVRLVYRHFPLTWDHPHAGDAARAAEAAARQGRFWEMHDTLFRNQRHLDREALAAYAESIGLDVERFLRDFADPEIAARVARDMASGRASGVRGTPTFFLDGRRYENAWDLDALRGAIERAATRRDD